MFCRNLICTSILVRSEAESRIKWVSSEVVEDFRLNVDNVIIDMQEVVSQLRNTLGLKQVKADIRSFQTIMSSMEHNYWV